MVEQIAVVRGDLLGFTEVGTIGSSSRKQQVSLKKQHI
jgi:hypothetical protein